MASLDQFFTPRTLVACHDAGAAQMILDNTSESLLRDCAFALKGPATNIFSGYNSVDVDGPLFHPGIDNVITGTGWQDTLEFNALRKPRRPYQASRWSTGQPTSSSDSHVVEIPSSPPSS